MHTSPLMGHRPQEGHYEDKHAHNPRRRDSTDRHAHAHTVRTAGKHRNAEITQKNHGSVAPSASVVTFNRRTSVDTNTNTNTKYTCDTGQTRNKLLAQICAP